MVLELRVPIGLLGVYLVTLVITFLLLYVMMVDSGGAQSRDS